MKFIKMIDEMTFVNEDGEVIEFKASKAKHQVEPDKHGFVFDADYQAQIWIDGKKVAHPIYRLWYDMKARTTNAKCQEKSPAYIGCYVEQSWRTYSNFAKWVMKQPRFLGRELDKDILVSGNKEYGARYCCFVPKQINTLLVDSVSSRGEYPLGVYFDISRQKHKAQCRVDGKNLNCRFPNTYTGLMSPGEAITAAHAWYQQMKCHAIKLAIEKHLDPEIDGDIIESLESRVARLRYDVEHGRETIKL